MSGRQQYGKELALKYRDDNACTLDGKPAKVVGWLCQFPSVVQLDGGSAVEFSWPAVARVMSNDRNFRF